MFFNIESFSTKAAAYTIVYFNDFRAIYRNNNDLFAVVVPGPAGWPVLYIKENVKLLQIDQEAVYYIKYMFSSKPEFVNYHFILDLFDTEFKKFVLDSAGAIARKEMLKRKRYGYSTDQSSKTEKKHLSESHAGRFLGQSMVRKSQG